MKFKNQTALVYPGNTDDVEGHFIINEKATAESGCSMLFLPIIDSEKTSQFLNIEKLINWIP